MARGKKRLRLKKLASQATQAASGDEAVVELALSTIRPNPYQPRRNFAPAGLEELAKSIKAAGVFQPVIVRQADANLKRYELIAGERRFRAAKLAGLTTIPAIIRQVNDSEMMEVAILENLQREDLTPLEEAQAYQTLMTKLNLTQAEVAERLGKSRPYIANYLRLLGLPDAVKALVAKGQLSMGQARTLLGLKEPAAVIKLAERAVKENLTVRQLEEIVAKAGKEQVRTVTKPVQPVDPFLRAASDQLERRFGTKVAFKQGKQNHGKIEIPYQSADELNRLLELLGVSFD